MHLETRKHSSEWKPMPGCHLEFVEGIFRAKNTFVRMVKFGENILNTGELLQDDFQYAGFELEV